MAFIQLFKPFYTLFTNRMGTFDEINTLILIYTALCFTDFVSDPYTKSEKVGPTYIGIIGTLISVHIAILLIFSIKSIILVCKKFYNRIKTKSKRINDEDGDIKIGKNTNSKK